jgi:hypothetical protein
MSSMFTIPLRYSVLPLLMSLYGVAILDKPENKSILLVVLTAAAIAFLALVIVDKPFRDNEGHAGWTEGDKAQSVTLVAVSNACKHGLDQQLR